MKLVIILLSAALALLLIEYIRYRRQVAGLCRQLRYHHEKETNIELRVSLDRAEIVALRDSVNQWLDDSRRERARYMEQETRTKELITDLAHDIRTPLTSLDGYFNLLCEAEREEDRVRYTRIITGRLNLLWDLLEQLFTYAKLQNGSYRLETEIFDCNQSLCEILLSFYEDFRAHGIEPQIDLPDGECFISGNKIAFGRVVQNILRNALLHGRDSVSIRLTAASSDVILTIRNNVREDWSGEIDKIFDRFYTSDPSRSRHSSGLGLPVARQLTEAMNGKISAGIQDGDFVITLQFANH